MMKMEATRKPKNVSAPPPEPQFRESPAASEGTPVGVGSSGFGDDITEGSSGVLGILPRAKVIKKSERIS